MPVTPPGDNPHIRQMHAQEKRAQEAEKESRKRIERAYENARATEIQYQKHLERLEDEYEALSEEERARQEAALLEAQASGYEAIRDLQRKQQNELRRLRKEAETQVEDLSSHYLQETYKTEVDGKRDLQLLQKEQHAAAEYAKQQAELTLRAMEQKQLQQKEQIRSQHETLMKTLQGGASHEQERLREHTQLAEVNARNRFEKRYENLLDTQNDMLQALDSRTSSKINALKEDYSRMLDAYGSRLSDPFYQVVRVPASLSETADAFILSATIPEYEQDRISVSVRGNQIVLTGSRRSEERLEDEPGRMSSTSSYQTYTETFPLNYPVESRQVTRRFEGDELIVTIPKKSTYSAPDPYQRPAERVRADRPKFPADLVNLPDPKKTRDGSDGTLV